MSNKKTSINEQTPATTNSIAEYKPHPQTTSNYLEGYIANSWNGGILKPIAYKKIMAGEKITDYSINGIIRMITPKVPVAQKLTTTLKVFFVPNNRVWTNHDKYLAQKGGQATTKIIKKPAFSAENRLTATGSLLPVTDTTLWRDSYASSYIPRIFTTNGNNGFDMPEISILPLRGFKAIYNDMLRHKVYDEEITEYKDDTISNAEFVTTIPRVSPSSNIYDERETYTKRGRRNDSYYTNYRTQSEGQNNTIIPMYTDLMQHNEWQKKIAESRSQAENEQKNDWDIVAEIRGSRPISDGKVQYLGMKEIGINYQQVSQTAYNTNEQISQEFQTLGATGAFSYTEFNVSLINYHEFKEDGYIHVIAQTSADTIFETGLDRNELNITWDSEYRPDLKDLKEDTITTLETNTQTRSGGALQVNVIGFKRKFSEYFKLPNIINGDLTTTPLYEMRDGYYVENQIPLKSEFQFFEISDATHYDFNTNSYKRKNRWLDYTDLLINKNLAIQEEIENDDRTGSKYTTWVKGANQLFMIAKASCITNQPIDENIKNDFKRWGEQ